MATARSRFAVGLSSPTLMTVDEILEDYMCPVCLEVPLQEIYQCVNGHIICGSCFLQIEDDEKCVVCREPTKVRGNPILAHAVEKILDNQKIPCTHRERGCMEQLPRSEMVSHARHCEYRLGVKTKLLSVLKC